VRLPRSGLSCHLRQEVKSSLLAAYPAEASSGRHRFARESAIVRVGDGWRLIDLPRGTMGFWDGRPTLAA